MAPISEGSQSSNDVTLVATRRESAGLIKTATASNSKEEKRRRVDGGGGGRPRSACCCGKYAWKKRRICTKVTDQTDPFSLEHLSDFLDSCKYGIMEKDKDDIKDLLSRREKLLAGVFATAIVAPSENLDVEKSISEQFSSSGKYGTVTKTFEELSARRKLLFGGQKLELNPPATPIIIDLEDDDEPPDKGSAVKVARAEKNGAIVHSVPFEKITRSSRPVVIIDLEDEEIDCPGSDLDDVMISSLGNNLKDLDCAEDKRIRGENCFDASGTVLKKNEGAIGSCEASPFANQVIDLDVTEDQKRSSTNFYHAGESDKKMDSGVIGCLQALDMHDDVTRNSNGGVNMGGESPKKVEEDEEQIKASADGLADVSEVEKDKGVYVSGEDDAEIKASADGLADASEGEKDKGLYVGVEDDAEMEEGTAHLDLSHSCVDDIWNQMALALALEYSKDTFIDAPFDEHSAGGVENCDHSFILKDDIGSVCRVCGLIEKRIDTIIEYQFGKRKRSGRTCKYERSHGNGSDHHTIVPCVEHDSASSAIAVHPRHQKLMKPHQFEGFNFLVSNLVRDDPGGCIMAHAPGSGKTFMIISFLQSFMARYPSARPLIVLPRGILSTWRNEFKTWQVEDMPLYDFYSVKAESRIQQLEVLEKWANQRSILFLGYKQFSSIVCDIDSSKTTVACQDILLTSPSILIMDEGHNPRNQETDMLKSLDKVQTPRKVVLSGTLYQNHVDEVFNVLNLVHPKFLRVDLHRSIKRRILSKVQISGSRRSLRDYSDKEFYELVEKTLLDDKRFDVKVSIIQDLREMTRKVLHYYKGDSLDELPGLVDFTVFLELSTTQKREVALLKRCKSKFKVISEGSAVYVHPQLKSMSNCGGKGKVDVGKIDQILGNLKEMGVKAKFYLDVLQQCESAGEKLLVFSQYLVPLKFLERLTVKVKNYAVGKEMFVITGDSDSEIRDSSMEQFNTGSDARVFFGSIKACGEGISLVGASRIIILDVHLNPSVTRQAIGRAFRPGQERKVYVYRLIASGSPEEEDHLTCFRKECVAKMWFEWNGCQGQRDFEMERVDANRCGDLFLESSSRLTADIVSVYKR